MKIKNSRMWKHLSDTEKIGYIEESLDRHTAFNVSMFRFDKFRQVLFDGDGFSLESVRGTRKSHREKGLCNIRLERGR